MTAKVEVERDYGSVRTRITHHSSGMTFIDSMTLNDREAGALAGRLLDVLPVEALPVRWRRKLGEG